MTDITRPPSPGDELRALLVAGGKYTGRLPVQAAVHLLTFTDLPDWRGFRDLVHIERVDDPAHSETYDAAFVPDWAALLDAKAGQVSGSGRRLLELAVSLAVGTPVDLREALGGFGHVGKWRVVEAVAMATGADEFYRLAFTPTPALDAVLDLRREMAGPGGRSGPEKEFHGSSPALAAVDWSTYERTCAPDRQLDGLGDLALFLGGSETSFTGRLLDLIAKAQSTPANLAALERGFPREVHAWRVWMPMSPSPTAAELCAELTRRQAVAAATEEMNRTFGDHIRKTRGPR